LINPNSIAFQQLIKNPVLVDLGITLAHPIIQRFFCEGENTSDNDFMAKAIFLGFK
jgi:hypothetical protein